MCSFQSVWLCVWLCVFLGDDTQRQIKVCPPPPVQNDSGWTQCDCSTGETFLCMMSAECVCVCVHACFLYYHTHPSSPRWAHSAHWQAAVCVTARLFSRQHPGFTRTNTSNKRLRVKLCRLYKKTKQRNTTKSRVWAWTHTLGHFLSHTLSPSSKSNRSCIQMLSPDAEKTSWKTWSLLLDLMRPRCFLCSSCRSKHSCTKQILLLLVKAVIWGPAGRRLNLKELGHIRTRLDWAVPD